MSARAGATASIGRTMPATAASAASPPPREPKGRAERGDERRGKAAPLSARRRGGKAPPGEPKGAALPGLRSEERSDERRGKAAPLSARRRGGKTRRAG